MVRHDVSVLLCVLFFGLGAPGLAEEPAGAKYRGMLEKLKSGDLSVDLNELRLAYADSSDYSPPGDPDTQKAVFSALSKKKYSEAIKIAQKGLGEDYFDIELHHALYIAYRETNEPAKSQFHNAVASGFIRSIMQSGDGKTPATAYRVLSTHEEYVILKVLGLVPEKQSLLEKDGHQYDLQKARNAETGEEHEFYFNIDKPYGYLRGLLEPDGK